MVRHIISGRRHTGIVCLSDILEKKTLQSTGHQVFAVNDFDEAFVGPYTWDLKRLAASIKLIGYEKALSDEQISQLVATLADSYTDKVGRFARGESSEDFALTLDNASGQLKDLIASARLKSRVKHLEMFSEIKNYDRSFTIGHYNFEVSKSKRKKLMAAFY